MRSLPPSKPLTGPAPPRRSVCARKGRRRHSIAGQSRKGDPTMRFLSWLDGLKLDSSRRRTKRGQLRGPTPKAGGLQAVRRSPGRPLPAQLPRPRELRRRPEPGAVVTADFNNDTVLDLAVANYGDSSTVSVLLGNADGTFQPALTSATGVYPASLAVGDFNADGKLDLATVNSDLRRRLRRERAAGQRRRHLPGPQQHRASRLRARSPWPWATSTPTASSTSG